MDQSNKDHLPAVPEEKPNLVKATKDFFGNALSTVKGKDLTALVEEFSSEMTLVAEGLSDDQARLHDLYQNLSSQQTIDKEETEAGIQRVADAVKETGDRIKKAESLLTTMRQDLDHLQKEIDRQQDAFTQYTKKAEEKKVKKMDNLSGMIRQLTWLVGVAGGAWIIVTILNMFK